MVQYFKKNWEIKLVCFFAAFCLWIYVYNIESNIDTTSLQVKVSILNEDTLAQSNLTLLPQSQGYYVTLTVTGSATDLQTLGDQKDQFRLIADLSKYTLKKGENNVPVELKASPSSPGVSIKNDQMLFVKINVDELVTKTFHIVPKLDGAVAAGFVSQTPVIKPTDIVVSGAAQYVSAVNSVVATGSIDGATKDLDLQLPLMALNIAGGEVKEVNLQQKIVEVVIPVKKKKLVTVNVKTKGALAKDLVLNSLTSTPAKVEISGNSDVLDGISSVDTEIVDLSLFNGINAVNAKLVLPKGVTLISGNENVSLQASLDKVIQKSLVLDVAFSNVAAGFAASINPITDPALIPFKETVVISGPTTQINNLKPEDVTATIDMNGVIAEGTIDKIASINVPKGITVVSTSRLNVKVDFKKQ